MHTPLDPAALDQLFLKARTYGATANTWLPKPVPEDLLRRLAEAENKTMVIEKELQVLN